MKRTISRRAILFMVVFLALETLGPATFLIFLSAIFVEEAFGIYIGFYTLPLEFYVMSLTPIILMFFIQKKPPKSEKSITKIFLLHFVTVQVALILGLILAVWLWDKPDNLLPDETRTQPFPFYWLFVAVLATGIFISIYEFLWYRRGLDLTNTAAEIEEIGKENQ